MAIKLGEVLLSALAGPLQSVGAEQLHELFMKVEPLETRQTILTSLYPIVDVEMEKLTTKSKTKIDDALIGAIKLGIESAAAESGIDLPQLDND